MFLNYDIRGYYPKEINENLAKFLTKKFSNFLKKKKFNQVLIAQDLRKSSQLLVNACYEEFIKNKIKVSYLGILPTPLFYHFCLAYKKPGVMITASHLPLSYNGFKFFLPNNKIWIYKKIIKKTSNNYATIKKIVKKEIKNELYLDYLEKFKKNIKLKSKHQFFYNPHLKSPNKFLFQKIPLVFEKISLSPTSPFYFDSDYDGDRIFTYYQNKLMMPEQILFLILSIGNYRQVGLPITIHKNIKSFFPQIKFYLVKTGHLNFKKAYLKYNLDLAVESSYHFYFFKEFKTEAPLMVLFKIFQFQEKFNLNNFIHQNNFPVKRIDTRNKDLIKKIINYVKINKFKLKKFDDYYFYRNLSKKDFLGINIRQSKTENNLYRIFIESNDLLVIKKFLNQLKIN
jgi:phosphomannomutase